MICPSAHGHIENLLHIPPEMIDNRKEQPIPLCLQVQQILKLITPKTWKLPIPKHRYEMNRHPVHVVSRVESFHFRV